MGMGCEGWRCGGVWGTGMRCEGGGWVGGWGCGVKMWVWYGGGWGWV